MCAQRFTSSANSSAPHSATNHYFALSYFCLFLFPSTPSLSASSYLNPVSLRSSYVMKCSEAGITHAQHNTLIGGFYRELQSPEEGILKALVNIYGFARDTQ
ncbi:hypothetical protein ILYODFUR_018982 [Ilyodon furcidens]|uniref:Uncharacterized protein n=1 Tax=Ilyodon furcidens TaxID=33524 RepID=A0ABV0TJS5_9TELE